MGIFDAIGDAVGGIGDAIGGVLKCVTSIVGEVVGQLGQFQSILGDQVHNPIQGIIGKVNDGSIWKGVGAESFMEEANAFLPIAQGIGDGIGGLINGITAAVDVLEQADTKAAGLVNDLTTEFENIYKG
jgi:phage-related protein